MITFLRPGTVYLVRWNIIEFEDFNIRRFVGYSVDDQLGRFSTEILEFDLDKSTGLTKTGSEYILIGKPGNVDPDALYVLESFLAILPAGVKYSWVFPCDNKLE